MVGSGPGRVAASLDDRCGGAKNPGGRSPDSAARTTGSARPSAGAVLPRSLRRSRSSASRGAADHRAALGVNPDASRFCAAPGSAVPVRHASAVPDGWSGSADRRLAGHGGGHAAHIPRRSKSGRGRSSCRSTPGRDSPRTQTTELSPRRRSRIDRRPVDERHDCRDTGSACVPSTVWGTASSKTAKFNVGAVLAPSIQASIYPAVRRSSPRSHQAVCRTGSPRRRAAVTGQPSNPPRAGFTRVQAAVDNELHTPLQSKGMVLDSTFPRFFQMAA